MERLKYRESLSILPAKGLEPGTLETRDQSANCDAIQDGLYVVVLQLTSVLGKVHFKNIFEVMARLYLFMSLVSFLLALFETRNFTISQRRWKIFLNEQGPVCLGYSIS